MIKKNDNDDDCTMIMLMKMMMMVMWIIAQTQGKVTLVHKYCNSTTCIETNWIFHSQDFSFF